MGSAYPNHDRYGFAAVVDSQGVVRAFQQTYRTTFEERPAVVSRTVHVTAMENVTVERPDWYEQAVANGYFVFGVDSLGGSVHPVRRCAVVVH